MVQTVLELIEQQIERTRESLLRYRPHEMNWPARARTAAHEIIPNLASGAVRLKEYVEGVLNASVRLRETWLEIRGQVDLPKALVDEFDQQLSLDDVLRESIAGEVVSKVVTNHLIETIPAFKSNGRSDYPDLYLGSLDYSGLDEFKRKRVDDDIEYGAALKGRRPVRVPDGLEIKTCRGTIRVDCHHPHVGLHLVLVFRESGRIFSVTDLCVAYLGQDDYHEAKRNTSATTVKYSFNGDRFVSLFA